MCPFVGLSPQSCCTAKPLACSCALAGLVPCHRHTVVCLEHISAMGAWRPSSPHWCQMHCWTCLCMPSAAIASQRKRLCSRRTACRPAAAGHICKGQDDESRDLLLHCCAAFCSCLAHKLSYTSDSVLLCRARLSAVNRASVLASCSPVALCPCAQCDS